MYIYIFIYVYAHLSVVSTNTHDLQKCTNEWGSIDIDICLYNPVDKRHKVGYLIKRSILHDNHHSN